jgi:hypothetical protein
MRLSKKASTWRGAFDRLECRQLLALSMAGSDITTTQQSSFNGVVATLVDTKPGSIPSDFTTPPGSVLINWGDGPALFPGAVVSTAIPGTFLIQGSHTYTATGAFPIKISVVDQHGETANVDGSALVNAAATPPTVPSTPAAALTIGPNAIAAVAGQPLATNMIVATFLDSRTTDPATDFNALITWGDGHTTAGTVTPATGTPGVFTVTGTNIYASAGTYATTVMIVSSGAAPSGSAMGVANVGDPSPSTFSFSGMLATVGNGPHSSTGYTNTNQPTFIGTALPFSTVKLYARPWGIDTSLPLGETVANASGQWTLTAGPLASLTYTVSATVTPAGGYPSTMMLLSENNVVHIDMAPKQVRSRVHAPSLGHHALRRVALRHAAPSVHYSEAHRAAKS